MAQTEQTIREQSTTVKGKTYKRYVVDYGRDADGKRVRKTFSTREAAETDIESRSKLMDQVGQDAKRITNKELRDAIEALAELSGAASLKTAAKFYMLHHSPDGGTRTVKEFVADFLEAKRERNLKPKTIKSYRNRLGRFAESYGDKQIQEVTKRDVQKFLRMVGGTPVTFNNYRRDLGIMFKAAQKAELIQKNPVVNVDTKVEEHDEATTFTPAQVQKLMTATVEHEAGMVPYFAIGIFTGLRPEQELRGLDWKDIDLENKRIKVTVKTAKRRRRRYVEMSDNLVAWLMPYRDQIGKVFWSRSAYENARKKAGVAWHNDIMRHSYGSYHVAQYQDAGKTMLQMGHKNMQTLLDHYVDAKTKEDAAKFWAIMPKAKGNVVQFTKAG